jgi:hypothetical protein
MVRLDVIRSYAETIDTIARRIEDALAQGSPGVAERASLAV